MRATASAGKGGRRLPSSRTGLAWRKKSNSRGVPYELRRFSPRLETGATGHEVDCRFVISGTQVGDLMAVPKGDVDDVLPGIPILRFANGRGIERLPSADMAEPYDADRAIPMPQAA